MDDRDKLWNDIALVHVKKDFDLIDEEADEYLNVAPICLPRFDDQDFLTGKNKGRGGVMKILIKYPAFEYSFADHLPIPKCKHNL